MATITWTGGANDGNWGTAGNWSGGVPLSTDDVFILTTSQDITAGLNQSAVTLASLTIGSGFRGSIGTVGSPLQINVSGTLTYAGSGALAAISGTIGTANIDRTGSGVFVLAGGTWTTVTSSSGLLSAAAGCVITTLQNFAATWQDLPWNATGITTLTNQAGTVLCRRSVTTATNGPRATTSVEQTGTSAPTVGTLNNYGRLRWNSSGTVTTGTNFPAATWDNSSCGYSFTVSTLNDWAGGSFQDAFAGGTVTISTRNRIGRAQGPALPVV